MSSQIKETIAAVVCTSFVALVGVWFITIALSAPGSDFIQNGSFYSGKTDWTGSADVIAEVSGNLVAKLLNGEDLKQVLIAPTPTPVTAELTFDVYTNAPGATLSVMLAGQSASLPLTVAGSWISGVTVFTKPFPVSSTDLLTFTASCPQGGQYVYIDNVQLRDATVSGGATSTPQNTATGTVSPTGSATDTPTKSVTDTPSITDTPSNTPTPIAANTPTSSPTPTTYPANLKVWADPQRINLPARGSAYSTVRISLSRFNNEPVTDAGFKGNQSLSAELTSGPGALEQVEEIADATGEYYVRYEVQSSEKPGTARVTVVYIQQEGEVPDLEASTEIYVEKSLPPRGNTPPVERKVLWLKERTQ